MKIALFGATGHIGQAILEEALSRGHHVVAIVRDPARLTTSSDALTIGKGDVAHPSGWIDAIHGVDLAIASLSARRSGDLDSVPANATTLLDQLPQAGISRLLWVGGAASLEVAPGVRVIDNPQFPAEWKPEANAQIRALEVFRASHSEIAWTYVSPPALIEDGQRSGHYRLGGEQLLVDAQGVSRISVADFAVAMIDRAERNDAPRQRITVAY
jgi:uncharacterized protein